MGAGDIGGLILLLGYLTTAAGVVLVGHDLRGWWSERE